jgi:hypothetical protein
MTLQSIHKIKHIMQITPAHKLLHDSLAADLVNESDRIVDPHTRVVTRRVKGLVTQLVEAASNPMLLLRREEFEHDRILGDVIAEGPAPKISYACARARQLARRKIKCIIWTCFARNVGSIADHLRELSTVVICPRLGTKDADQSRERIVQFQRDDRCHVMIARLGTAIHGFKVRNVCQHAIYVTDSRGFDLCGHTRRAR